MEKLFSCLRLPGQCHGSCISTDTREKVMLYRTDFGRPPSVCWLEAFGLTRDFNHVQK